MRKGYGKYGKLAGTVMLAIAMGTGCVQATSVQAAAIVSKNVYEVSVVPGADAKTIQSYLDQNANGAYEELIVKLPAGNYYLDRTLYVYSNTTILAEEGAKIYKQKAYGAVIEGKLTDDKGGYESCVNVTIDGGLWDAKAIMDQAEGTETFRFIHASNITIQNAEFANVPEGSHFIVLAGVKDAVVTNCSFHGYGDDGDGSLEPKEAVQLDIPHDATIVPTQQQVCWDDLPCKDVTISDCEFYDFSRAIGSHMAVAGVYHEGITIENNKIYNMSEVAIKLYQYKDTKVLNNQISDCAGGIVVYTELGATAENAYLKPLSGSAATEPESNNIVIEGNTITRMTVKSEGFGDAIRISATKKLPMSGVKITGNTISSTLRYGIFVTWTANAEISENKLTQTGKHGILLEESSTDAVIRKNTVKKAGESGIAVYTGADRAVISENVIEKPEESGIYLYKVTGVMVGVSEEDFNTITKPGKAGIYITTDCTENTVTSNVIENAGTDGIWVYSSAKNTLTGNTISAAEDGIDINTKSKMTVVKNNTIVSAGACGIWLSSGSTSSTISGNTIKKYATKEEKKYAIGVYQSGGTSKKKTTISSNKITGSGKSTTKDAIRVSNSDYVDIKSNTIKNATGYGVYIYMSKYNNVTSNKITSPKKGGIYVTTTCDKVKIQKNTVSKPQDVAIMIYQAPNSTVSSNKVTTTADYPGIRISQSNGTKISSNTVTGAQSKREIWITGSDDCTSSKNIIK